MSQGTMTRNEPRGSQSGLNHATLDEVKQDMLAIKKDLAALRGDSTDYVAGAVQSGANRAREKAEAAWNSTKGVAGDAVRQAHSKYDRMCDFVRQNPTTSILIAIGVGAIASRIVSRK